MDQRKGTGSPVVMFKTRVRYDETTQPREFADATGLIDTFGVILDPTILCNVQDIMNGMEWNSSLPVELTLQELAQQQRFQDLYSDCSNSKVATNLTGSADEWNFDASTEAIKRHPLIYMLFKDVVAVVSFQSLQCM